MHVIVLVAVGVQTWVKARWRRVLEAKAWRWCLRDRVRACSSRGSPVEKSEDSQWSSAVESRTLEETQVPANPRCYYTHPHPYTHTTIPIYTHTHTQTY